jgi:hypothetical protein
MSEATNESAERSTEPSYRQVTGVAESLAAIGEVVGAAQRTIRVFDFTLAGRGFNSVARYEALRHFFVTGRTHKLQIALHEPELLDRECARLLMLLRQFPMSIEIHRTLAQARDAADPFVLADDHSVWHQLHHTQTRAVVALHSPADAVPLLRRFEEIWELSEPAVSATTLGL